MTMDTYYEYASYETKEYRIDVTHKWSKKKVCITWFLYSFQSNNCTYITSCILPYRSHKKGRNSNS
jgi:hypothetical protein